MWGTTFELTADNDDPVSACAGALRGLVERLNARLFDRLQAERNADRRALIAMFPGQVASLEPLLLEFLHAAFAGTSDSPAPLLRGVYFTSGTQEGTPIDRLTGALARSLGVDQARAQTMRPVQGRSYFLERLLKEVIVGEASLVAHSPAALRRRQMLRMAGYAVAALLVLATAGVLWHVRSAGQREIAAAATALDRYEQTARGFCRWIRSTTTIWRDWRHCSTRRARCRTVATNRHGCRPACRSAISSRPRRGRSTATPCNGHCCHG